MSTPASTFDVSAARRATPGCDESVFLASAGSSLPTRETLDTVIGHLQREAAIGGYAAAEEAAAVLAQGRADLAALLGGHPAEIALVPSDSVAWVKAWWGWVLGGNVAAGRVVLIDRLTYHSHFAALDQTRRLSNFEIAVMPSLPDGTVDVGALRIDERVAAVCATVVGTHCGNVNPVEEIGSHATAWGVPLFVDACQALGQMELNVARLGCAVLTATGRKFLRGPRGSGLLWVREDLIERFHPPGLDGTSTEWDPVAGLAVRGGIGRFEEFEVSYAAMVGLAAAARQANALGMAAIEARVVGLADRLRAQLCAIGGVTVRDTAARRCGIVTFDVAAVAAAAVVAAAERQGVRIDASTANWAALDMAAKGLQQVVRASPHYFNTEEELDRLVRVVERERATPPPVR